MADEGPQFDIYEETEGDLSRFAEYNFRVAHEALLESLRHGKVWPSVRVALNEAGLDIVPIEKVKH